MDAMNHQEWYAVLSGLEREARYAWDAGVEAINLCADEFLPCWVERVQSCKSAYDKIIAFPLNDDEPDEETYEEPYEPVYQEPDSFYTYQELDNTFTF